jgi:hypothetical protein
VLCHGFPLVSGGGCGVAAGWTFQAQQVPEGAVLRHRGEHTPEPEFRQHQAGQFFKVNIEPGRVQPDAVGHFQHFTQQIGQFGCRSGETCPLAVRRGYSRVYLTTGPRQPEAKHLYLNSGYEPLFDLAADPETIKFLAFSKDLEPRG